MSANPETLPAIPVSAIIQVIERAATNPQVDIDKMERLLLMQERIMERQAQMDYMAALADMQPHLPVIDERGQIKDGQGNVRSTYALWEDINEVIKPILAEYGFGLSFRFDMDEGNNIITAVLSHRSGHAEQTSILLPDDGSGSKNAVQARGSATSYGKRYTACALLNITSRLDADDDGAATGQTGATKSMSPKRKKEYCEGLLAAQKAEDSIGLLQLWDELNNEERQQIWNELRSYEQAAIKKMIEAARQTDKGELSEKDQRREQVRGE